MTEIAFSIENIYIKDMTFEVMPTSEIFMTSKKPDIDMHLSSKAMLLNDELFEVILQIKITAKIEEQTVYLLDITQAGIFRSKNITEEEIDIMPPTCANILFPFIRESISDIVQKGGFPQLLLSPINFDILYQERINDYEEHTTH